jgi:glycosyltransferase involved in cell wall biosynthesis
MKVSIIIPAYNHEKYISAAIRSVLEQSHQDFELIIINDGSTDNTEKEILKFTDSRMTYIAQKNKGAHHSINSGIDLAKGEYISVLNSDDIYDSYRLEKCLNFLESHKDYSVVITEVQGITDGGVSVENIRTPQFEVWLNWYKEALLYFDGGKFLLSAFAKNILITTSNYFMRREIFEKVGRFRGLRYAHDWDMLLRLAQCCNVHLMREILLKYRIHQSNTVHEKNAEDKVKFEVNWLIAENIRHLKNNVNILELMDSIKRNHYINFELLSLFLMVKDTSKAEMLLDFQNDTTLRVMESLK